MQATGALLEAAVVARASRQRTPDTGYDQAHLIADFHAIANRTPRALLAELREAECDNP